MKKGFTLVELAIVLVIIGLLIGGILVAQSMILTVKIQKVITDLQQYEIASHNFKTNFKFYPGDSPAFTPPGTGDNELGFGNNNQANCNGIYANSEQTQFFAHLSEAGMIKTHYIPSTPDSICGGNTGQTDWWTPGVTVPYTEVNGTKYHFEPNMLTDVNLSFRFYIDHEYVVPLESKLGVIANSPTAVGLVNEIEKGTCLDNTEDLNVVPCSDPTALFGLLMYYISPI